MKKYRMEPPDGGWGWVVAVAASVIFLITFSLLVSNGILMVALMEAFGVGRAQMTWIPIICFALSRLIAPLSSIMSVRLSHRLVVFTGGLLMTTGYGLSFLAQSIVHLYLTLGLTVGLGCGLVVFPTTILTTHYFTSHISLANGLYTAGASFGCIVGPLFTEFLLEYLGLHFTFLMLAGEALHICVGAALFQPVEWHYKRIPIEPPKVIKTTQKDALPLPYESPLVFTTDEEQIQKSQHSPVVITRMVRRQPSWIRAPVKVSSLLKLGVLNLEKDRFPLPAWNSSSFPINGSNCQPNNCQRVNLTRQISLDIKDPRIESVPEDGIYVISPIDREENKGTYDENRRDSLDSTTREPFQRRRSSRLSQILRQASIPSADPKDRLPTTDTVIGEDDDNDDDDNESSVPEMAFLRRPIFYLMGFTGSAFFLILNMIGIIIPDYAREELVEEVSLKQAALLLSICSATDFVTRFLLSWVWDLPFINRTYCHLASCIFCGLAFCAFSVVNTYNVAIIVCVCIGISSGISGILVTVLFMQNIGRKGFGLSLSMSCMISGMMMLGCGTFVGVLKDQTGSYMPTFLIVGLFVVLSALTWLVAELTCLKAKDSTAASTGKK